MSEMPSTIDWPRVQAFAKRDYAKARSFVRAQRRIIGRIPTGPELYLASAALPIGKHPGYVALLAALRTVGDAA